MSSLTGINLWAEKSAHLNWCLIGKWPLLVWEAGRARFATLSCAGEVFGAGYFAGTIAFMRLSKYGATAPWVVVRLAAGQIAITSGTSPFWLRQNDAKSLRNFSPAGR